MARENRQHHFVPCAYLKEWTDTSTRRGKTWVKFKNQSKAHLKAIDGLCIYSDLYDIKGGDFDKLYLEKNVFSHDIEPKLEKLISYFKVGPKTPGKAELRGAMHQGLYMWARNPLAMSFIRRFFEVKYPDSLDNAIFHTEGNLTSIQLDAIPALLDKAGAELDVYIAMTEEKFVTSDNPCSLWSYDSTGKHPSPIQDRANTFGGFWLFPISPDCTIKFSFSDREDGKCIFKFHRSDMSKTISLNNMVRRASNRLTVEGIWYKP